MFMCHWHPFWTEQTFIVSHEIVTVCLISSSSNYMDSNDHSESQDLCSLSLLRSHMCFQLSDDSGMCWVLAKKDKKHNQDQEPQRGEVMCQGHTAKSAVELGIVSLDLQ